MEDGERLAERIQTQFPVAMIDEFQDTDPVQYSIFDRVYRVEKNCPEQALILIGDPKQAIYAFRGADIHTYLRAREAIRGRHYTLDTNFHSSKAMVLRLRKTSSPIRSQRRPLHIPGRRGRLGRPLAHPALESRM